MSGFAAAATYGYAAACAAVKLDCCNTLAKQQKSLNGVSRLNIASLTREAAVAAWSTTTEARFVRNCTHATAVVQLPATTMPGSNCDFYSFI